MMHACNRPMIVFSYDFALVGNADVAPVLDKANVAAVTHVGRLWVVRD